MPSALATLFFPITPAKFIEEYWPGLAMAVHGSPERLSRLLETAELSDVANLVVAAANQIKVVQAFPTHQEFFVAASEALDRYRRGDTLCIIRVDEFIPVVAELVLLLQSELSLPTGTAVCNAYASPHGGGTPRHFDRHEVIILQVTGMKEWEIADNDSVRYPTHNYVAGQQVPAELDLYADGLAISRSSTRGTRVVLQPGSVLFLPRGCWHATLSSGNSLSLSIALKTPTGAEIVAQRLRERLLRYTELRRPLTTPGDYNRTATLVDNLSAVLERHIDQSGPGSGIQ